MYTSPLIVLTMVFLYNVIQTNTNGYTVEWGVLLILKRIFNDDFDKIFNGIIILDPAIENKLHIKHKVYRDDLEDSLGDPYRIILRAKQKDKPSIHQSQSNGKLYEILCESSDQRVLFIIGRLFENGHLYIITSYWANRELEQIYYTESEVLRDE